MCRLGLGCRLPVNSRLTPRESVSDNRLWGCTSDFSTGRQPRLIGWIIRSLQCSSSVNDRVWPASATCPGPPRGCLCGSVIAVVLKHAVWSCGGQQPPVVAGSCLLNLMAGRVADPEAKIVRPENRLCTATARRPGISGGIAPASAPQRTRLATVWARRIAPRRLGVILFRVPILAPLPHVAVHVVESPCIRSTQVTDAGSAGLRKALPRCSIIHP